jgi:hypothetical protein
MFPLRRPSRRAAASRNARAALLLVTGLVATGCGDTRTPVEPPDPPPTATILIRAVTPRQVTGVVGTEVDAVPTARVTRNGVPAANALVTFTLLPEAGELAGTSARTDGAGMVTVGRWLLGPSAGTQRLTMRLQENGAMVVFEARASAGPLAQLIAIMGTGQTGRPGEQLLEPLAVRAADAFGNPRPDVSVKFTVTAGGGTVDVPERVTSLNGAATAGWRLGPGNGVHELRAEAGTLEVAFSAIACETCPDLLFVRGGSIYRKVGLNGREVMVAPGTAPAWSADGQRLAFIDGSGAIRVMDAGTGAITVLAGPHAGLTHATWSPDGEYLLVGDACFDAGACWEYEFHRSLYLLRLADQSTTTVAAEAGRAAWSPAADRIAFEHSSGAIRVMRSDGSGVTDLTNGVQPAWSPDGERLAFVRCPRGQCGIFLIDMQSRAVTQLDLGGVSDALHPSWSPDGTTITFSGHPSGSNIYTVPTAGGPVSVFLGSAESLAWRP